MGLHRTQHLDTPLARPGGFHSCIQNMQVPPTSSLHCSVYPLSVILVYTWGWDIKLAAQSSVTDALGTPCRCARAGAGSPRPNTATLGRLGASVGLFFPVRASHPFHERETNPLQALAALGLGCSTGQIKGARGGAVFLQSNPCARSGVPC